MSRVTITLTAEIADLASFWPDAPRGATIENVGSVLQSLRQAQLLQQLEALQAPHPNAAFQAAITNVNTDTATLIARLLATMTIVVT